MGSEGARPAGTWTARLAYGAGAASALVLALLWSRKNVSAIAARWLQAHPVKASPDLVWGEPPKSELECGVVQPREFMYVVVAVAVAVAAWCGLSAILARWPRTRPATWALSAVTVGAAIVFGFKDSTFLGQVSLGAIAPLTLLFAVGAGPEVDAPVATSARTMGAWVLVVEAIALGWGIWLTFWGAAGVVSVVPIVALAAAAAYRAGAAARPEAVVRDALVGAPLLLLPLLGMLRDPSPVWLVAALVACNVVAIALRYGRLRAPSEVPTLLGAVLAPCAAMVVVLMPMRFRELGSIDHFDHESQHLGWINSIHFGKLMMADAGYIYGPLREYLLALYCRIGGYTLEHVREAHVWTSFVGAALMLWVGWRVSRGRLWLQVWWAFVLLVQTALLFLVKYRDQLSFGWVDLARSGFACAALVGAMELVTRDDCAVAPWRDMLHAHRRLIAWGALCGIACLYSQDYGPCAAGAVGLTIAVDAAARSGLGSLRARAERAVQLGLAWSAGVVGVLAGFLAVYACFGKAGLMIHRLTTWTGFLLSAAWSGTPFHIDAGGWSNWNLLSARDDHGIATIAYAMPAFAIVLGVAYVIAALVRRAWSPQTALVCAILLFAYTSYRHALIRVDIFHSRSDGTGATLLFFALMCALSSLRLGPPRGWQIPVGAPIVAAVAVGWPVIENSWASVREKLHAMALGDESPSHGAPYDNRDVPRGGDCNVPANVRALVRFVNETTKPNDPVWVTTGFMTGGALQFAIGRRNPTPFDVAHELTTRSDQAEVLEALEKDPPVIVVGDYLPLIGEEARRYLDAHWRIENAPGYGNVRRYVPPGSP